MQNRFHPDIIMNVENRATYQLGESASQVPRHPANQEIFIKAKNTLHNVHILFTKDMSDWLPFLIGCVHSNVPHVKTSQLKSRNVTAYHLKRINDMNYWDIILYDWVLSRHNVTNTLFFPGISSHCQKSRHI